MAAESFVDDILRSTKETLAERLASPLLGSFVLAWCTWNYKFFVVLLSAASVTRTFQLIETAVFPDWHAQLGRGILYPLLTAIAYVFLYPYPAKYVAAFTLRRQIESNAQRAAIQGETLLTAAESKRVRTAAGQTISAYEKQLELKDEEIAQLKAALRAIPAITPNEDGNIALTPVPSPTDPQFQLLRVLEEAGGQLSEDTFVKRSKMSKVVAEFNLTELVEKKMLNRRFDPEDGGAFYEFDHEGRRALVNRAQENAAGETRP